jgi:hypothetical protein
MLKKGSRWASPSMVVALVALLFALTGTAVAGAPIAAMARLLGLNSKQKGQVKTVADQQIRSKAGGLHVSFATTAGRVYADEGQRQPRQRRDVDRPAQR